MFINQVKKQDIASIPESSQRVLFEHKPSSPRRKYLYDTLFPAFLGIFVIFVCFQMT